MKNRKWVFPTLVVLWALILITLSSQSYEEQSLTPILVLFNTPFWYELLDGISFMYGGSKVSVQTAGVDGFLEFFIRKGAHLFVFFVFGFLMFGVWRVYRRKTWKACLGALLCVVLFAGTDEIHQMFTDGRSAMVEDVIIDTIGGFLGVLFFMYLANSWRKRD